MDVKKSEALRLADALKNNTGITSADVVASELLRLCVENETLKSGYDAARLEIESLQLRDAERHDHYGAALLEIASLQAQLEAIGAGGVEPLRERPVFGIPGTRDVDVAAAQKAWDAAAPYGYFRPEPFGWTDCGPEDEGAIALYEKTAASGSRPLTDRQIDDILTLLTQNEPYSWRKFARAIEAAHGITEKKDTL